MDPKKRKDDTLDASLLRDACEDLAFMRVSIEDLQAEIMENGWQDEYQNGANQSGTKQSPASKMYIDLQKEYNNKIVRVFIPLLERSGAENTDELLDFLRK